MWVSNSWILIALLLWGYPDVKEVTPTPMFFNLNEEWKAVQTMETAFYFPGKDSLVEHEVEILKDSSGFPLLFFSDIVTPVCADGKCQLADIMIYWDLLGNYTGFAIDPDHPLTKYDHDPFTKSDYQKLHQLLSDRFSILQQRTMEELVDKKEVQAKEENKKFVDGITSATKAEIKEAVVEGGLYSCYTLWHLVNDGVRSKAEDYLKTSFDQKSLTDFFLFSDYQPYQGYGLKQLTPNDFQNHQQQVFKIFESSEPITRAYILKKMPVEMFADSLMCSNYFAAFEHLDINTRTTLIRTLESSHPLALGILSHHLDLLTKNQMKSLLDYLSSHESELTAEIRDSFNSIVQRENYTYAYLVKDFLDKIPDGSSLEN